MQKNFSIYSFLTFLCLTLIVVPVACAWGQQKDELSEMIKKVGEINGEVSFLLEEAFDNDEAPEETLSLGKNAHEIIVGAQSDGGKVLNDFLSAQGEIISQQGDEIFSDSVKKTHNAFEQDNKNFSAEVFANYAKIKEEKKGIADDVLFSEPAHDLSDFEGGYGLNGELSGLEFEPNTDFAEPLPYLLLGQTMSVDQIKPDGRGTQFFSGQPMSCQKWPTNCCREKGFFYSVWGQGACTSKEAELAVMRDKRVCVYLGEEKIKKYKVTKKKNVVYCCFNSRLAKVVQQGARAQLGWGWGSVKSPDCRALSVSDLERVNWEKVDFSEFYSEVSQHASTANLTQDLQEQFVSNLSQKNQEAQKEAQSNIQKKQPIDIGDEGATKVRLVEEQSQK